jgi:branched-chain amino acid transport system substrate-binding protein
MRRPLLVLLLATLTVSPAFAKRRAVTGGPTVTIGGLFSLTGDGESLGRASDAALTIAVRDINAELAALRVPFRMNAIVADTHLTPAVAATEIVKLHEAGAQFVIGPQSSAEAAAVLEIANENDIIVISQGSTASSLAIPGDNLFRLAPNDRLEGAALAALMKADGIDTLVTVYRADAGNTGLRNSTETLFVAQGGTAFASLPYDPATSDFTSLVQQLDEAVHTAENTKPGAHIGVFIAAFEEGAEIMDLARLDSHLTSVRWYGGDGLTKSEAILEDPEIAAFAVATHFAAPTVGLSDTTRDRWEPLSEQIEAMTGFSPDPFSLSVYDAAWVAALSVIEANQNTALYRESFVRNVQRYWGVTGPTALDAAGDRKFADFDFYAIVDGEWVRTAHYSGGTISR